MAVVVKLLVEVDDVSLGGGGGGSDTTPVECIIPPNADTASVRIRATIRPIRRNLFIVVVPPAEDMDTRQDHLLARSQETKLPQDGRQPRSALRYLCG